jgi:hypothetical protein
LTAFDPPALTVVGLAQQNLAGRGNETHVCSHGMYYRRLLMLFARFPWNRTRSRRAYPRPEPCFGTTPNLAPLICAYGMAGQKAVLAWVDSVESMA